MAKKPNKRKPKKSYSEMTYREKYMIEYKQFYDRWKRIEKRGYKMEERFQPNIPQKIGLREFERIKKKNSLDYIYDKATFYDMESDRYVSGKRGLEIERSRAGKKGAETKKKKKRIIIDRDWNEPPFFDDAILREIENRINQAQPTFYNPHGKTILVNFLQEQIALYGREAVAMRLQRDGERAIELADRILWDSKDKSNDAFIDFVTLLANRAMSQSEAMSIYDSYANEGWD